MKKLVFINFEDVASAFSEEELLAEINARIGSNKQNFELFKVDAVLDDDLSVRSGWVLSFDNAGDAQLAAVVFNAKFAAVFPRSVLEFRTIKISGEAKEVAERWCEAKFEHNADNVSVIFFKRGDVIAVVGIAHHPFEDVAAEALWKDKVSLLSICCGCNLVAPRYDELDKPW